MGVGAKGNLLRSKTRKTKRGLQKWLELSLFPDVSHRRIQTRTQMRGNNVESRQQKWVRYINKPQQESNPEKSMNRDDAIYNSDSSQSVENKHSHNRKEKKLLRMDEEGKRNHIINSVEEQQPSNQHEGNSEIQNEEQQQPCYQQQSQHQQEQFKKSEKMPSIQQQQIYICPPPCSKGFAKPQQWQQHFLQAHELDSEKSQEIRKKVSDNAEVFQLAIKEIGKKIVCSDCQICFPSVRFFKIHFALAHIGVDTEKRCRQLQRCFCQDMGIQTLRLSRKNAHKCPPCGKTYSQIQTWNKHWNTIHKDTPKGNVIKKQFYEEFRRQKLQCPICQWYKISHFPSLIYHIKQCYKYGLNNSDIKQQKKNKNKRGVNMEFIQNLLNLKSQYLLSLRQQKPLYKLVDQQKGLDSNKLYEGRQQPIHNNANEQENKHESENDKKEKIYICPSPCQKGFLNSQSWEEHFSEKHKDKDQNSDQIRTKVYKNAEIFQHSLIKLGKKLICPGCKECFPSIKSYKFHFCLVHLGVDFIDQSRNIQKVFCESIGIYTLKIVHAGFRCRPCGKVYTQTTNWLKHFNNYHKDKKNGAEIYEKYLQDIKNQEYQCPFCKKTFQKQNAIIRHVNQNHKQKYGLYKSSQENASIESSQQEQRLQDYQLKEQNNQQQNKQSPDQQERQEQQSEQQIEDQFLYVCPPPCKKGYVSAQEWQLHFSQAHKDIEQDPMQTRSQVYKNSEIFQSAIRQVGKKIVCSGCKAFLSSVQQFKIHFCLTHLGINSTNQSRKIVRKMCKSLGIPNLYVIRMDDFKCPEPCGAKFSSTTSHGQHFNSKHLNDKNSRMFKQGFYQDIHKQKLQCPFSPTKQIYTNQSLIKHINKFHKSLPEQYGKAQTNMKVIANNQAFQEDNGQDMEQQQSFTPKIKKKCTNQALDVQQINKSNIYKKHLKSNISYLEKQNSEDQMEIQLSILKKQKKAIQKVKSKDKNRQDIGDGQQEKEIIQPKQAKQQTLIYVCLPPCSKGFANARQWQQHFQSSHKGAQSKAYEFRNQVHKNALVFRLAIKEVGKKIICPGCNFCLPSVKAFKIHFCLAHLGIDKITNCRSILRAFCENIGIKTLKLIPMNDYMCPQPCGKTFTALSSWRAHFHKNHKSDKSLIRKRFYDGLRKREYQCPMCQQYRGNLQQTFIVHIKKIHKSQQINFQAYQVQHPISTQQDKDNKGEQLNFLPEIENNPSSQKQRIQQSKDSEPLQSNNGGNIQTSLKMRLRIPNKTLPIRRKNILTQDNQYNKIQKKIRNIQISHKDFSKTNQQENSKHKTINDNGLQKDNRINCLKEQIQQQKHKCVQAIGFESKQESKQDDNNKQHQQRKEIEHEPQINMEYQVEQKDEINQQIRIDNQINNEEQVKLQQQQQAIEQGAEKKEQRNQSQDKIKQSSQDINSDKNNWQLNQMKSKKDKINSHKQQKRSSNQQQSMMKEIQKEESASKIGRIVCPGCNEWAPSIQQYRIHFCLKHLLVDSLPYCRRLEQRVCQRVAIKSLRLIRTTECMCPYPCGKVFNKISQLFRHYKAFHKKKDFACIRHQIMEARMRLEVQCPFCKQTDFVYNSLFTIHIKLKHKNLIELSQEMPKNYSIQIRNRILQTPSRSNQGSVLDPDENVAKDHGKVFGKNSEEEQPNVDSKNGSKEQIYLKKQAKKEFECPQPCQMSFEQVSEWEAHFFQYHSIDSNALQIYERFKDKYQQSVNFEKKKAIFKVKDVAGNLEEYEHNATFENFFEKVRVAWKKQHKNGKCTDISEVVWSGKMFRKGPSPTNIEELPETRKEALRIATRKLIEGYELYPIYEKAQKNDAFWDYNLKEGTGNVKFNFSWEILLRFKPNFAAKMLCIFLGMVNDAAFVDTVPSWRRFRRNEWGQFEFLDQILQKAHEDWMKAPYIKNFI